MVFGVPPKKLSFRLSFSLSDMTNYKSAFGKVCRIKNRHTFKSMPILNSAYFTECRRHIVIPCGKVCRIKNRHTFRILPILKSAYFKSMPILNSSYHAVKYAELRIGSILKVCRFVIRHITQTETQTETEANFTHFLGHFGRIKGMCPGRWAREFLDLPLLRYMYLIDTRLLFHDLLLEVILYFLRNMFFCFLHVKLHKCIDYITTCRGIPCYEGLPRPCIVSHICLQHKCTALRASHLIKNRIT